MRTEFRVVEHSQNLFGKIISSFLPEGFKPHMRTGTAVPISGRLRSRTDAHNRLQIRRDQLTKYGKRNEVCLEIEEVVVDL